MARHGGGCKGSPSDGDPAAPGEVTWFADPRSYVMGHDGPGFGHAGVDLREELRDGRGRNSALAMRTNPFAMVLEACCLKSGP